MVCLVHLDCSTEFSKGLLEIGKAAEFQICQRQTVVPIGVFRVSLRHILVFDEGLLVLALLEIARGSLVMFGFLGLRRRPVTAS